MSEQILPRVSGVAIRQRGAGLQAGSRSGSRTVLGWQFRLPGKHWKVVMLCDCGHVSITTPLKARNQPRCRKCGGITHDHSGRNNTAKRHRLYTIWNQMKQRCDNENKPEFEYYGARGISVCVEWSESYEAFRDWALANGYDDSLCIDRIDSDGNYEPTNCRWITIFENSRRAALKRWGKAAVCFLVIALTSNIAEASGCLQSFGGVCIPQQRVVRRVIKQAQAVKKVYVPAVEEKYLNIQHFFVGQPANLGYAPLQAAQYGQIQRNVQRSIDMLRELQQYQQQYQQMQQPVYAPQQYVAPQQYAAPVQQYAQPYAQPQQCQGCGGQLLQQQQATCNCQSPLQSPLQRPAYQQPAQQYQQPLAAAQLPQGAVMQQNCAQCHSGATAKGNFNIADVPRMNTDDRMHVLEMAASGEMPKDAQDLNDQQLGQLARELFAGSGQANGATPNGSATLPPVEQAPPASQFNGAH